MKVNMSLFGQAKPIYQFGCFHIFSIRWRHFVFRGHNLKRLVTVQFILMNISYRNRKLFVLPLCPWSTKLLLRMKWMNKKDSYNNTQRQNMPITSTEIVTIIKMKLKSSRDLFVNILFSVTKADNSVCASWQLSMCSHLGSWRCSIRATLIIQLSGTSHQCTEHVTLKSCVRWHIQLTVRSQQ